VKFAVLTFGCRVNQADSLAVENGLLAAGAETAAADRADVIIVNSCSVTSTADQGTRQAVRRAARENPHARLIVTGCYASRCPGEIASLPGVARVVGNAEKEALPRIVMQVCEDPVTTTRERFAPDGDGPCGLHLRPGSAGRTAFTLRVQTGCDEPCAYCIIPSTRGSPVSRPLEWVLDQLERACAAGYREITLTGVHLGAYGRDLSPSRSLAELLDRAAALDRDALIRIGSLEPMDCTPEVLAVFARGGRLAPAFHLPLQHASDRILRAMRRPYSLERYDSLVASVRQRLPQASIGSDVIVGFPGETDDDFRCLQDYLDRSPLSHLHVFPYSDRPGTEASRMGDRVEGAIIRDRAQTIRAVGRVLAARFRQAAARAIHRALVVGDGTAAVTASGLHVQLVTPRRRNEWVEIRISVEGDALREDAGPPVTPAAAWPRAEPEKAAGLRR
jgi:threonylcarbamoyladenosine tRNA methylthiotransferase MtaB